MNASTLDNNSKAIDDDIFDAVSYDPSTEGFFGECVEAASKALFHMSYKELVKVSLKRGVMPDSVLVVSLAMVGKSVLNSK